MHRRTGLVVIAVLFSVFLSQAVARADDYHYNNALIGDRAAGLGGAYIGISDDASGMYYNPAGIVYSTGRSLSASVNAFYNLEKKYDGVIGGNGWVRKSSALLPNFFGVIQPMGSMKVGFSYAVPDSALEDQDQTFAGLSSTLAGYTVPEYVINFNNEDNTYNFGPTVAFELGKNLSVGATLYFHFRKTQTIFNEIITLRETATGNLSTNLTNRYYESSEEGVRPVFGVMWTPAEKLSLGLAVSRTLLWDQDSTFQQTTKAYNSNTVTRTVTAGATKREYPWHVGFGAAWFPTKTFLFSADVNYYSAVEYNDGILGKQDRRYVINGAVGLEYYLSQQWAARAGLFTNIANTKKMGTTVTENEQIDLVGGSLSITHFTRNTSVTLGGTYSQGDGEARIISGSSTVQDASIRSWSVFLSSSYSY